MKSFTLRRSYSSASFYTALQYNPKETAENLKKSGAFVPGYRPGDQTAKYIEKITLRLTLIGAIYVTWSADPGHADRRGGTCRSISAALPLLDHRCRQHGLHDAGAGVHDVATV
jgi:hypothetical protein